MQEYQLIDYIDIPYNAFYIDETDNKKHIKLCKNWKGISDNDPAKCEVGISHYEISSDDDYRNIRDDLNQLAVISDNQTPYCLNCTNNADGDNLCCTTD